MNHDPTIVRATVDHVEIAVTLFDAYRQFYGQRSDLAGAREFLLDRLGQKQSVIFLALRSGSGCGFTQLYPSFSSVAMRPIWILNDLFVTPEARRLGVGKLLMQTATEFAAANEAKRLVLSTGVDHLAAQSLYELAGWTQDDAFYHYDYEL